MNPGMPLQTPLGWLIRTRVCSKCIFVTKSVVQIAVTVYCSSKLLHTCDCVWCLHNL